MITKLWEKIGEGLGQQLTSLSFGAAAAFWAGAVLVLGLKVGWPGVEGFINKVAGQSSQLLAAVGAIFVLLGTQAVASLVRSTVLRLAEGYWPWLGRRISAALTRKLGAAKRKKESEYQALARRGRESLNAEELSRYCRLDAELRRYPVDLRLLMPTPLGNLLRGAEEAPGARYGPEVGATWAHLWLVLPKELKEEIAGARASLDGAGEMLFLSLVFVGWALVPPILSWVSAGVVILALLIGLLAYLAAFRAAGAYAALLRAAYDLHRFALYEQLRLSPPTDAAAEKALGESLTAYLFRGEAQDDLHFAGHGATPALGPNESIDD